MLGLGVGEVALLRVLREMQESAPAGSPVPACSSPRTRVGDASRRGAARIRAPRLQECAHFADVASLLGEFKSLLEDSLMGTRLYVAGPESFIGLAMKIALEFNLNKDEIRAEECGSLARRVYCIHCRATTENVRTNIVRCLGCERWLLVRDHYSRRLAAYMGVMVDAEAPGELPPIKEVFL
jgi:hypothetical protein